MDHWEVLHEQRVFSDLGKCDSALGVGVEDLLEQVLNFRRAVRHDSLLGMIHNFFVAEVLGCGLEFCLLFL